MGKVGVPAPGPQPMPALPCLPGTLWSQVRWCLGQPGFQTFESGTHGVFSQPGERWGEGAEMGPHSPFPEESVVPLAESAGPMSQHCLLETQEPGRRPEAWT